MTPSSLVVLNNKSLMSQGRFKGIYCKLHKLPYNENTGYHRLSTGANSIGVRILNKLIADVKSKFSGKKGEDSDEELDEIEEVSEASQQSDVTGSTGIVSFDSTQTDSLADKIKAKLPFLQKKSSLTSDEDEDPVAEKKKKRSKIIRVIIGLAILGYLAEEFFPVDEPKEVDPASLLKKRPGKKPPSTDPAIDPATDPEAPPVSEPPPVTESPEDPPVEAGETPDTDPVTDEASSEAPVMDGSETTFETPSESPVDVTSTVVPEDTVEPDDVEKSDAATDDQGQLGEPDLGTGSVNSVDSIDETVTLPGSEDNLTDQILEDLEKQARTTEKPKVITQYVTPPDYEYRGRGLVYNCVGKHWACIDGPSYKTCEDNSASLKHLQKATECYPFNVYETTQGCEKMQNRMVSSSAKTEFCND